MIIFRGEDERLYAFRVINCNLHKHSRSVRSAGAVMSNGELIGARMVFCRPYLSTYPSHLFFYVPLAFPLIRLLCIVLNLWNLDVLHSYSNQSIHSINSNTNFNIRYIVPRCALLIFRHTRFSVKFIYHGVPAT